jgi:hypothetical protein
VNKRKKSLGIQLSYEVSGEEKIQATKMIAYFDHLIKILDFCDEHISLIYVPFKDNSNVSPEQTFKARAALRRFRDKVADNFNVFKKQAFKCFLLMQPFSADTQIIKLQKSFVSSIGDLEKSVNNFIDIFSDLKSKEFAPAVVKGVEAIKKEVAQTKQIISERIQTHVQENILAKNWTDSVSEEIGKKVEKQIPQSIKLVEERNSKLKNEDKQNE